MIIVRSPLRISLGGGGTDLPSYYRKHGGFVLSAAIDKYIYVSVQESFKPVFSLKYSKLEDVQTVEQIEHPVIREALKYVGQVDPINLSNLQDIPAGSGLGSSGAFTVALLKALHTLKRNHTSPQELAEQAFHIEAEVLGQSVGKQDQYISALGGINSFSFREDDEVLVEPLQISTETKVNLEDNLLLFFTGFTRSASDMLKDQDVKSLCNDKTMVRNLDETKNLGVMSRSALENGELDVFAELMDLHWRRKKERDGMTNPHINDLYELGKANGAKGGKLVGAGGGGFLMFYAKEKDRLRKAMRKEGLQETHFRFDWEGVSVLVHS